MENTDRYRFIVYRVKNVYAYDIQIEVYPGRRAEEARSWVHCTYP